MTPRDWFRVSLEADGKRFNLRAAISLTKITDGDMRIAKLDPSMKREGLTLAQAKKNGAEIDAAMRKLHGDDLPKEKKGKK